MSQTSIFFDSQALNRSIAMKATQEERRRRRYALLMAARDSDYVKKVHGGYLNVFTKAFGGDVQDEAWDCFRVVDGEFPPADELDAYDGFVVSGSPHEAYGNERWIARLRHLLRTLDAMHKRVLGVCFGHQVLCQALGGRVGRAHGGWDIGIRKVTLVDNLGHFRFGTEAMDHEAPHSASIIEIHQDEVWMVPARAEVIGCSEKTGVEVFAIGDHVLGIQGHPEYTKDILNNLIDRLVSANTITRGFGDEAKRRVECAEPDRKFWLELCKRFLEGR